MRTETRYEFTDTLNYTAGNHTFKFGGDIAFIRIPSAIFELNFAGLFNFGGLSATTLAAFPGGDCASPTQTGCAPAFSAVQQYGLGFPSNFIQGFGNPVSRLNNKPVAFFAQDSWKLRPNLTVNYGVRYDVELTDQIEVTGFRDPLSGITLSAADVVAAQDALNVQQGFPRDKNNWAPRLAVAWDVHTRRPGARRSVCSTITAVGRASIRYCRRRATAAGSDSKCPKSYSVVECGPGVSRHCL